MNDYLTRLAERALGTAAAARPDPSALARLFSGTDPHDGGASAEVLEELSAAPSGSRTSTSSSHSDAANRPQRPSFHVPSHEPPAPRAAVSAPRDVEHDTNDRPAASQPSDTFAPTPVSVPQINEHPRPATITMPHAVPRPDGAPSRRAEPHLLASPVPLDAEPAKPPQITITIGRVDIRSGGRTAPAGRSGSRAREVPLRSLDAYLRERNRGRR